MIEYRCECGKVLQIDDKYAGQSGQCKGCGRTIHLPPALPSSFSTHEKGKPTLQEVQSQIRALGNIDSFGTKKEIKHLPEVLAAGESVLALTSGIMDGNTWLIVCTERRIIMLDKGMLYGLKQRETPLERINSLEHKTGLIFGSIGIWDGATSMSISNVRKDTVLPFVATVNRAIESAKKAKSGQQQQTTVSNFDVASQIEKLADLRDKGVLTDQEFQNQKAKILGS